VIEIGAVFQGRYQVKSRLGSGGFGWVYAAVQLSTGKTVAVKLISPAHDRAAPDHSSHVARFQQEMALCARLSHPNIVELIDSGTTPDGQLFAVFELVPGEDLAAILAREGALEPREAKHLMLQVLDALACAHGLGVVHRDMKPHNIMLTTTGARRNAIVLDFGIGALVEEARPKDQARLTPERGALGTPAYAAPEQLRGSELTTRSDLYAWGLVFLECLTGERVMRGGSNEVLVFKQLSDDPIPIPAPLAAHRLGEILRVALAKDVRQRNVTAAALFQELDACDVAGLSREALALRSGGDGAKAPASPASDDPASPASTRSTSPPLSSPASPASSASSASPTSPVAFSSPSGARSTEPSDARGHAVRGQDDAEDALERKTMPLPPSKRAPRVTDGERRQITAVCCGISVSGAAADDPEVLDEILSALRAICAEVAAKRAGHVAGLLGNRVLIYFGYPVAREDDAHGAARAALEIAQAIKRKNVDIEARLGVCAAFRIGIHTGLALVRDPEEALSSGARDVVGSPSSVAAELDAIAEPDAILVSDATHRLLQSHFSLDPAGAHRIQGLSRTAELFLLTGESQTPMGLVSRSQRFLPLVGRTQELHLLEEHFRQARLGAGKTILITGEPGIGKSRLAVELSRRAQGEAWSELVGRCAPESRHSALRPIVDIIERLLGFEGGGRAAQKVDALIAMLARRGFKAGEVAPLFASLLSLPPDPRLAPLAISPARQKELTLSAICALLFEMASERPLLLILEDLHWADPTTLELLAQLIEEAEAAAICVLCTARPEFSPPWVSSKVHRIKLDKLMQPEVEAMVARVTEGKPLPDAVREQVVRRTDGVPLFIEELTRMVLESGAVAERGGRYVLLGSISDLSIPDTLRHSLMIRLDRMGEAKEVAQLASILGREFEGELLAAVSSRSEAALGESLDRLVRADLLHRRRHRAGSHYSFKHALVRDVAYESLPTQARREHHARAAAAIEARFPALVEARPELLAHHHAAGGQPKQAIAYAKRAAAEAASRCANAEAVGYARQAIGWVRALSDERERAEHELALYDVLAPALMALRGYGSQELEDAALRAKELIDALGEVPEVLGALRMLAVYRQARGRHDEALALAERSLALARRTGDALQELQSLVTYALCLHVNARLLEARASIERALSLCEALDQEDSSPAKGPEDITVAVWILAGSFFSRLGYLDRGLEYAKGAVERARAINHGNSLAAALGYLGGIYHYRRELEKMSKVAGEMTEVAGRYGLAQWSAFAGLLRGVADGAPEIPRQVLAGLQAYGQVFCLAYWGWMVAESEVASGEFEAGIARLSDSLSLAAKTGEHFFVPEMLCAKGELLLRRGAESREEAEAYFRDAIERARDEGSKTAELRATVALCKVLRDRGRTDEARARLSAIYGWFTEGFDYSDLANARALARELGARELTAASEG
jgi:TOMM system kinase/cyclase fusion protein